MAEKRYGVGIAGISWVAHEHIKAWQKNPHTQVVALQSASQENAEAARARHGLSDAQVYTDYEQMLADPRVDIISISSTNEMHARQGILGAQAGKHMLIEKPVATTLEDLYALQDACNTAGVKTIVSFVLHWNPYFESVKAFTGGGAMGTPFYGEVDYFSGNWDKWYPGLAWVRTKQRGGSAFLAAGCHAVDALRYLMDGEIQEVFAYSGNFTGLMEWDATISSLMKFQDGRIGRTACVLEGNHKYIFNVRLLGPKGSIVNERFRTDLMPGTTTWNQMETVMPDTPEVSHHPFQGEIDAFMEGVVNGAPILPDINDAVKTHEVCFAAEQSARENRPVTLPLRK